MRGGRIWLYIPPELEENTVSRRTALKQRGVHVAYGDALNVAKADGSFDIIVCDMGLVAPELGTYAQEECARLAAADGQVIWWAGSERAACVV